MVPDQDLVVLLPVFEDRGCLRHVLHRLPGLQSARLKAVVVDDGSILMPVGISELSDAGIDGVVVRLRRNLGQQKAIAVGLHCAHRLFYGCPVVVMDADGQDRPEAIPQLLDRFGEGGAEIVVATRGHRTDNWTFKICYEIYKITFKMSTGKSLCFGTFSLLSNKAVQHILQEPSLPIHFPVTLLTSGLPISSVLIDRGQRYTFDSHIGFWTRLRLAVLSFYIFFRNAIMKCR